VTDLISLYWARDEDLLKNYTIFDKMSYYTKMLLVRKPITVPGNKEMLVSYMQTYHASQVAVQFAPSVPVKVEQALAIKVLSMVTTVVDGKFEASIREPHRLLLGEPNLVVRAVELSRVSNVVMQTNPLVGDTIDEKVHSFVERMTQAEYNYLYCEMNSLFPKLVEGLAGEGISETEKEVDLPLDSKIWDPATKREEENGFPKGVVPILRREYAAVVVAMIDAWQDCIAQARQSLITRIRECSASTEVAVRSEDWNQKTAEYMQAIKSGYESRLQLMNLKLNLDIRDPALVPFIVASLASWEKHYPGRTANILGVQIGKPPPEHSFMGMSNMCIDTVTEISSPYIWRQYQDKWNGSVPRKESPYDTYIGLAAGRGACYLPGIPYVGMRVKSRFAHKGCFELTYRSCNSLGPRRPMTTYRNNLLWKYFESQKKVHRCTDFCWSYCPVGTCVQFPESRRKEMNLVIQQALINVVQTDVAGSSECLQLCSTMYPGHGNEVPNVITRTGEPKDVKSLVESAQKNNRSAVILAEAEKRRVVIPSGVPAQINLEAETNMLVFSRTNRTVDISLGNGSKLIPGSGNRAKVLVPQTIPSRTNNIYITLDQRCHPGHLLHAVAHEYGLWIRCGSPLSSCVASFRVPVDQRWFSKDSPHFVENKYDLSRTVFCVPRDSLPDIGPSMKTSYVNYVVICSEEREYIVGKFTTNKTRRPVARQPAFAPLAKGLGLGSEVGYGQTLTFLPPPCVVQPTPPPICHLIPRLEVIDVGSPQGGEEDSMTIDDC